MKNEPFVIERVYHAPVEQVWSAITDREKMKQWYFDIADFKAELGCEFQFVGTTEKGVRYVHQCKITELVVNRKLSYSWQYEGQEGYSVVTFELFPEGENTRLKLMHAGLETFPESNPDMARKNFEAGWTALIGQFLKEFVEKQ